MLLGRANRRESIILLCYSMIAMPAAGLGQETAKAKRIGFLRVGSPPVAFIDGFRQGLRELGLVEGRHYFIEFGLAQSSAQVPGAAAELVRRGVDIILASGTPSVLPARDIAGQIPVVFVATLDPVVTELVTSLARPGRNITGMTSISGDLIAKRMELIREVIPDMTRVAILVRASSPTAAQYVKKSRTAAVKMGIELQIISEVDPKDLDEIFTAVQGSSALVIADDAEFTAYRAPIAELALRNRVPTVSGLREMAEAGGLMAYEGDSRRTLSTCREPCIQDLAGRSAR